MVRLQAVRLALAAAVVVAALPAAAQNAGELVERYSALAGSEENAEALVSGLRDGKKITLTSGSRTTTIDPPTQKMGYGNVDNALSLAEASLDARGISDPTPAQLKAALQGVLQMRADGQGWGQIANALGFRLGDLKSARHRPAMPERVARAARPERPEKPVRPEKPERPEKPQRPEAPQRPHR